MTHRSYHFRRHFLFGKFSVLRVYHRLPLIWINDMLIRFEEIVVYFRHWICSDVLVFCYYSSCFVLQWPCFWLRIFINMFIWDGWPNIVDNIHAFTSFWWFELHLVKGSPWMEFFIVEPIHFLWVQIFIIYINTLCWLNETLLTCSWSIWTWKHISRLSDWLSILSFSRFVIVYIPCFEWYGPSSPMARGGGWLNRPNLLFEAVSSTSDKMVCLI